MASAGPAIIPPNLVTSHTDRMACRRRDGLRVPADGHADPRNIQVHFAGADSDGGATRFRRVLCHRQAAKVRKEAVSVNRKAKPSMHTLIRRANDVRIK